MTKEEQRIADNEIYKKMWRLLEKKQESTLAKDEDDFFNEHLAKISQYYADNAVMWLKTYQNHLR